MLAASDAWTADSHFPTATTRLMESLIARNAPFAEFITHGRLSSHHRRLHLSRHRINKAAQHRLAVQSASRVIPDHAAEAAVGADLPQREAHSRRGPEWVLADQSSTSA